MKTTLMFKKAALLGTVGAALVATSAQAAFNPASGNLIAGFVETTTPSFDIVVDLGAYTRFTSGSAAILLGGSSVSEAYQGIGPAQNSENRFASSDISTTFGDLQSLLFSVFGVQPNGADNSELFLTRARGVSTQNTQTTPWNRAAISGQGTTGNNLVAVPANAIANGVDFSDTSTRESAAGGNSYAAKIPVSGYTAMEANTGTTFTGATIRRNDLYLLLPGSGPGDFLGYFEYQADGDLWFIPENFVPVPEASTYGLVAGAGLLFMALRRQMGSKTA